MSPLKADSHRSIENTQENDSEETFRSSQRQPQIKKDCDTEKQVFYSFLAFAAALPTQRVARTAMIVTTTA